MDLKDTSKQQQEVALDSRLVASATDTELRYLGNLHDVVDTTCTIVYEDVRRTAHVARASQGYVVTFKKMAWADMD